MNRKITSILLSLLLILSLCVGCSDSTSSTPPENNETTQTETTDQSQTGESEASSTTQETNQSEQVPPDTQQTPIDLSSVPAFSGSPYVAINNNVPYFTKEEITATSFEQYAPLDSYGRCGVCVASIGRDLMPTEERGSIGMVKPSGWHTVKYDCVDGKYLYNRCHLIGYQLTGENANRSNLITGTRYLNMEGMLPFENMVADYVKETGNHVMYRATPIFEGSNLLASGVLMEGLSVEDNGAGITFCIYAYNVQPNVTLNYATGDSSSEYASTETTDSSGAAAVVGPPTQQPNGTGNADYIINKNTGKFHKPNCSSVSRMKEDNKEYYTGSRDDLIANGYSPCENCNP